MADKTALITGASGGLGAEFARIFAREGYDLVLVARSADKLTRLATELESTYGIATHTLACDLSREDAAARVAGFTEREDVQVDVLVNNAGLGDYGDFARSDLDKQANMVNLDVRALVELTYWYVGQMLDRGRGGRILNLASIAAFMPGPYMSVYFASKSFVLSFTEAISEELRGTGITCTALCPGPTGTGFWKAAGTGDSGAFGMIEYASASEVAEYGYRSLMRGKVIAVPGLANKVMTGGVRFVPRSLVRRVVGKALRG